MAAYGSVCGTMRYTGVSEVYFFRYFCGKYGDRFWVFRMISNNSALAELSRFNGFGFCVFTVLMGHADPLRAMNLPSGVDTELHEVLVERIGDDTWVRFRFLAPEIDPDLSSAPAFPDLEQDFSHMCRTFVLPYLEAHSLNADRVVISLADREVEFGVTDPDATQYFEQFRIESGECRWEAF